LLDGTIRISKGARLLLSTLVSEIGPSLLPKDLLLASSVKRDQPVPLGEQPINLIDIGGC
jgi:hypothetical protein